MNEKLKEILLDADLIGKSFKSIGGNGMVEVSTLSGIEFERWKTKIRALINKLESDELTESILKTVNGFNGWSDEKDFLKLVSELEDLLKSDVNELVEESNIMLDKRKVFVVHGRNMKLRNDMFSFLRTIDVKPMEWIEAKKLTGKPSPYIGDVLDAAFNNAQAILVMLTPDDEAKLRDKFIKSDDGTDERELTYQARPNVLFEAGMAIGRMENRTILLEFGKVRKFSDIAGRNIIKFSGNPESRQSLIDHLKIAGVEIKVEGIDWLNEGEFEI